MSKNNNIQDDESSSRVIDSFIRRAVDEGDLDPDDMDGRKSDVFWDKTTIRAAVGGLFVLGIVNLFFYYNMRVAQVDNTEEWIPERRGFLVEYREGHGQRNVSSATETSSESQQSVAEAAPSSRLPQASINQSQPENKQSDDSIKMDTSGQAEAPSMESSIQAAQAVAELPESSQISQTTQPENAQAPVAADNSNNSSIDSSVSSTLDTQKEQALTSAEQIKALVNSWAQAWTFKQVDDYLALYSKEFVSQGGAPFEPWAELRRERILAPDWIHVSVENIKVAVNTDSVVAEFVQVYASSDFSSDSLKTLIFKMEQGRWKIIRETVQPQ